MAIDVRSRLGISDEALAEFCRKWKIVRLELFGSALRDDFDPASSDLDLLVTFSAESRWSLFDHVEIQHQLSELAQRPVDLLTRRSVEGSRNPFRKRDILDSARLIYAA